MNDNKNYLKNSLIFQMSLGSKELFHSNVWAWLMEKDSRIINVFFDVDLARYKVDSVLREYHKRDIVVELEELSSHRKYYLLLENKIKSLPTREQLDRYTDMLDGRELLGATFTGLVNPFRENPQIKNREKKITAVWRFARYDKIADGIEKIVAASDCFSGDKKQQIGEYCEIIRRMDKVLSEELEKAKNRLAYENGLTELRINDLFVKLKGATFIDYMNEEERKKELPNVDGYDLYIAQSFHNGKATLDFRYTNWKDEKTPWLTMGIQLEGKQYRRVAERGDLKGAKPRDIYHEFEQKGWFDGTFDKQNNRAVFGKPTSMAGRQAERFNKYMGENSAFVYQYYDITEECNGYEELFASLKEDLLQAKNILENMT